MSDWDDGYAKGCADERAQYQGRRDDMMRALTEELLNVRVDLRAKVEALWLTSDTDHDYNDGYEAAKREFLDILDGEQQ